MSELQVLLIVDQKVNLSVEKSFEMISSLSKHIEHDGLQVVLRGSIKDLVLLNVMIQESLGLIVVVLHENMMKDLSNDLQATQNIVNLASNRKFHSAVAQRNKN